MQDVPLHGYFISVLLQDAKITRHCAVRHQHPDFAQIFAWSGLCGFWRLLHGWEVWSWGLEGGSLLWLVWAWTPGLSGVYVDSLYSPCRHVQQLKLGFRTGPREVVPHGTNCTTSAEHTAYAPTLPGAVCPGGLHVPGHVP